MREFQSDSVDYSNAKISLLDWYRPRRLAKLLRERLVRRLREEEAAQTFVRLIQSKHVADLQLIAVVTLCCALFFSVVTIPLAGWHLWFSSRWEFYDKNITNWWLLPVFIGDIGAVWVPIVGGFWTVAAVILAWCYKSGNARLGIVDLFASEMTTLCHAFTIAGLTQSDIDRFTVDWNDAEAAARARETFTHFDSTEVYTPVFDANAKDLQVLNVRVVTSITSFYTYWKARRDARRRLASTVVSKPSETNLEALQSAMRNVIYMQFLAFESARKAIDDLIEEDLIELEASHAENTITILLSELPAYRFLLNSFKSEDVRHKRLDLRRPEYLHIVETITSKTTAKKEQYPEEGRSKLSKHEQGLAADWDKAIQMLETLRTRYQQAFPDEAGLVPDHAPKRITGAVA